MTYNPMALGRIGFAAQTTYGTAITSGFTALECEAVLPPTGREIFTRDNVVKQGHYALNPIDGSQHGSGDFSITMPLHGYSTAASLIPTAHAEALFLESILGGLHTGGRTVSEVTDTGTSVATMNLDSGGSISQFTSGEARAVANASSVINATYLTGVGVTDMDIAPSMESLHATGADMLSSLNCLLTTDVTPTFFTFEWRSLQGSSRLLLEGCVPTSCELTLDAKAQPTIAFTFTVNSITASADTGGDADLAEIAYANTALGAAIGANAARMTRGASTEIAVSGFKVAIEQTLAPALDHNASQGVGALICTGRTVTASFTELLTGAPTIATSGASTDRIFLQLGSSAAGIVCMLIGAPVLMETGELADQDGVIGQTRTYQPGNYTGDTATAGAGTPDPADSDFRISFL